MKIILMLLAGLALSNTVLLAQSTVLTAGMILQPKLIIDPRDIPGVDCTGVNDSSSAYASLFSSNKEHVLPASVSTCNPKIAITIEPSSGGAWSHHGLAGSGGFGAGSTISCTMSGTPCFWFDRQRDSYFGHLNLNLNNAASVGVQVSQLGTTTGQISTNNVWHDLYIYNVPSGGSGIELIPNGDTESNNELQLFEHVGMFAFSPGVGIGFNTANPGPNCRGLGLRNVTTNSFSVGYAFGCASQYMLGGLQESNRLDFTGNSSNQSSGTGFIALTHSESSKQWLSGLGAANPFGFLFNRNEMNAPDLGVYQLDLSNTSGPFISVGNTMLPNASVTKIVQLPQNGGSWISIGDKFPNTSTANLPDLSHGGQSINIVSVNRYKSTIAIGNGANGDIGSDLGASGLYLLSNDSSDGGSSQAFYASPGLDIAAVFNPASGGRVYIPWRFIVTGQEPSGNNPIAKLSLLIDNDPITGGPPADTSALSLDFTGATRNGGTFNLPTTVLQTVLCASLSTAPLSTAVNGTGPLYCSDCKNVTDDTTGTFDSAAACSGHGTTVLRENGAWRVH